MDFWGLFNYNYGFGMNNWFMPSISSNLTPFWNNSFLFSSYQFPVFNFTPNFWNINSPYLYTNTPTLPAADKAGLKEAGNTEVSQTPIAVSAEEQEYTPAVIPRVASDQSTLDGYSATAGKRLADIALNNSVGWSGYCARSVKNAISQANLGEYQLGHAYQMSSLLRNNSNFREIPTDTVDVKDLPAGCVLVYDRGCQGYSREYGHTEITTGDGRAVSDGITKHLHKKPSAIFMPVEHNYLA